MSKLQTFVKLFRAWLASGKVSLLKAMDYAWEVVAAIEALPPGSSDLETTVAILEGIIMGTYHHDAVTASDGTVFPAGPVTTPAHAMAVMQSILIPTVQGVASKEPEPEPINLVPLTPQPFK